MFLYVLNFQDAHSHDEDDPLEMAVNYDVSKQHKVGVVCCLKYKFIIAPL